MNLKELAKELNYIKESPMFGGGAAGTSKKTMYYETTLKLDGKEIDLNSVEIDGVETDMGMDDGTSGALVISAKFTDGTRLSDDQLNMMNKNNDPDIRDFIQHKAEEEFTNSQMGEEVDEGSCGYAPDGEVDVNNTDKMTPAGPDLIKKIKEVIKTEIKKLMEEPNEGNAFAVARLKAIKAGEKKFKLGDKEFDVTDVSDDDKKAASEV